ncbi:hypothetical protein ENSA5_09000 [Enhygromyxa salina]|uniref:Uncharacterized protein n=1 Tax=Enhygromyxa salina TaxID=215803 RepID=A0A2S9YGT6_9BACT|nr:hypothetical protein ENSA5_09000 [Enhygromyxa salina]
MVSCSESIGCPLTPGQFEALADEIATLAARVDVAEHALLTRLRLFGSCEAWGPLGFLSCATNKWVMGALFTGKKIGGRRPPAR